MACAESLALRGFNFNPDQVQGFVSLQMVETISALFVERLFAEPRSAVVAASDEDAHRVHAQDNVSQSTSQATANADPCLAMLAVAAFAAVPSINRCRSRANPQAV